MNDLTKYYEKNVRSYGMPKRRFEAIMSLIGEGLKGQVVLDVGCGDGTFGKALKGRGAKVIGIDISVNAVKEAKKKLSDALIVDLNSQKLPFSRNTFDVVVASEMMEHLFNPLKILEEIKKVLKPGGILIVTTPNFLYWGHRLKFLKGDFGYQDSGPFDRGHIHFYTYKTLLSDIKSSGLNVNGEQHIFLGSSWLRLMESFFPAFFAYQLVIKATKNK